MGIVSCPSTVYHCRVPSGPCLTLLGVLRSLSDLFCSGLCNLTGWLVLLFQSVLPGHSKWVQSQTGYWSSTQHSRGSLLAGAWVPLGFGPCWAMAGLGSFPWLPSWQRWQQGASRSREACLVLALVPRHFPDGFQPPGSGSVKDRPSGHGVLAVPVLARPPGAAAQPK